MKLYVWHDVLTDYTSGMAFALAESADEARGMLIRQVGDWHASDFAKEPEVHEVSEKFAAYVHGGA